MVPLGRLRRPLESPHAFREFVLKIHSRCDLACDYCYVYTMADDSWRGQPKVMSTHTIDLTADRIAEHVKAHGIRSVSLTLHGGEPLLAGPELIGHAARRTHDAVASMADVNIRIQTNGVRLTDSFLRLFDSLNVRVGISLDGGRAAQNRHRRTASGRGSHSAVIASLKRLTAERYRHLFAGLLCTIDLYNDPVATYEELLRFQPPVVDFLLPNGNWSAPPPARTEDLALTPYADWLIKVFDRWYESERRETRIRFFEDIIAVLLGGQSRTEGVGLAPVCVAVVETDGSIEQSDLLKSAYSGAPHTGLHVAADSFDQALRIPGIAARQLGIYGLADICLSCDVHRVCGGGLYPHRYRAGVGFMNPSVYCSDLYRLIGHIRQRLIEGLATLRAGRP